mgnify:CR=1 FL=1
MKTFLISDTHFGHANVLNFTIADGSKLRPGFDNIYEHDEYLIEQWNKVVGVNDKVYHLGDVGFKNFTALSAILSRLNGTKVLIKGNHDNFKISQYAQHFKDVRATHQLDGVILSHIPLHEDSLNRWKGNIHGHLHNRTLADNRYVNVSVECLINYAPVDFEGLREYYKDL